MSQMELDPSHIMQVGMGFWPSKTVLSAVELELFTRLGQVFWIERGLITRERDFSDWDEALRVAGVT